MTLEKAGMQLVGGGGGGGGAGVNVPILFICGLHFVIQNTVLRV